MLGNRELVLDTFCEVHDLLLPYKSFEFWDFANHTPVKDGIYLIGREQFRLNTNKIKKLAESNYCKIILSNPAEGSETLLGQINNLGILDLVRNNKILVLGGGDMDDSIPHLCYDSFLPKLLDYKSNIIASQNIDKIFNQQDKPYKFLFLNGRVRPQRKFLLEKFKLSGLLDQSLWTNLETGSAQNKKIRLIHNGEDLMLKPMPVQLLDPYYEVERYRNYLNLPLDQYPYSKNSLFNHEWGEVYLTPEPYVDTYFSLVTETVFNYPYSFRTEKIWKPIAMGHPWIAVANAGYYRDIRNLGFRTFENVIDESFDQIDHSQTRIERIAQVVEDLCRQDLASFLKECYTVCKYNQQHLAEMSLQVRKDFPDRFFQFIKKYTNE